ncbi:MAG: hypothetical protein Q9160_005950 [Pyrenula sp. 1 TL-2023]
MATKVLRSVTSPFNSSPPHLASSPNSSNTSPKPSDSTQEADIKSKRALDSRTSPDTASLQTPVTPAGDAQGQSEEGEHTIVQDKEMPEEEKARRTEREGMKPLDEGNK